MVRIVAVYTYYNKYSMENVTQTATFTIHIRHDKDENCWKFTKGDIGDGQELVDKAFNQ